MERYVKSNRFIQLDGSHVTTQQAKREEEQLLDLVQPEYCLWPKFLTYAISFVILGVY